MPSRQEKLTSTVMAWLGVQSAPHRFGGLEFLLGTREIGHVHGNTLVDLTFTSAIREQLVSEDKALPHHIYPDTALVSFYMRSDRDLSQAIWLMRLSYLRILGLLRRRGLADPVTDLIDIPAELVRLKLSTPLHDLFSVA